MVSIIKANISLVSAKLVSVVRLLFGFGGTLSPAWLLFLSHIEDFRSMSGKVQSP